MCANRVLAFVVECAWVEADAELARVRTVERERTRFAFDAVLLRRTSAVRAIAATLVWGRAMMAVVLKGIVWSAIHPSSVQGIVFHASKSLCVPAFSVRSMEWPMLKSSFRRRAEQ